MNILLSTLLFGVSALILIAIAQLVNSVVVYRTTRQPIWIRTQKFFR